MDEPKSGINNEQIMQKRFTMKNDKVKYKRKRVVLKPLEVNADAVPDAKPSLNQP